MEYTNQDVRRQDRLRCTENSCQFENLFLTKLTG